MADARTFSDSPSAGLTAGPGPGLRPLILAGFLVIAVFFLGFGGWAAIAPLASAALAPGELSVDSNRKTIQHLEGGIVAGILVRDGDRVAAGDELIRLDEVQPRAALEQLQSRFRAAAALEARLVAERDGDPAITFPNQLLEKSTSPDVAEVLAGEVNVFNARRRTLEGSAAILRQRIGRYGEEIKGLEGQMAAEQRQMSLLDEEVAGLQSLVDRKLAGTQRLLELKRLRAEVDGSRSRNLALIARARQNIGEEELRVLELETDRTNEVVAQLRAVQGELFELRERIGAARDVLRRTVIRAPIEGTIVGLQVHTVGGVIAPREPLMDIVPTRDRLVVQARVDPKDIDVLRPGLRAQVRLTAYTQRHLPPIEGVVSSISADRLSDERTGRPYFLARVELGELPLVDGEGLLLYPGMQADVMILTGERTALDYLLRPLSRGLERALRED